MQLAVCMQMIAYMAQTIETQRSIDRLQSKHAKITQKESIEQQLLKKHPGRHVVFVSYARLPSPHEEWIYNPADVDDAPVIWALDLGCTQNEKLLRYYAGRSVWSFKPAESLNLTHY